MVGEMTNSFGNEAVLSSTLKDKNGVKRMGACTLGDSANQKWRNADGRSVLLKEIAEARCCET